MAVGFPTKVSYANGDVFSASDINDTNGTINLLTSSTLSRAAGKNLVINGGFDIWQRGTSISLAASTAATYTTDRFQSSSGTSQATTISRQSTNDTTNLPNIQYCARIQRNSGQTGTGAIPFVSSMESVNCIPYAGKAITYSFYARAGSNYSAASNALTVYLISGTGTDQNRLAGAYTGETFAVNQTATLTTTWQRFTYTATLPTNCSELASFSQFTPVGTAGTNDYFEITGIQIELGSVATTFTRAGGTISGELQNCQRYCYSVNYLNATKGVYNVIASGRTTSASAGAANIISPVSMRVAPTSIAYGGNIAIDDGSTAPNVGSFTISQAAVNNTLLNSAGASGLTAFRPALFYANNDATAYIRLEAEL